MIGSESLRIKQLEERASFSESSLLDRINRGVYHARGVERIYAGNGLDAAEAIAFLTYQPAIAQHDVLDLGIGAGRTTRLLAPLARSYVGSDYSPVMVQYAKRKFPNTDIRLLDMRDLSVFSESSFDSVFAICNLLDAVSHADRLRTLTQIRRVLRRGGLLFFSSHNRSYRSAGSAPKLTLSCNPIRLAGRSATYFRQYWNFRKLKDYCRHSPKYSILTDMGHDFSVLHYYIDLDVQTSQLSETGFSLIAAYDRLGERLNAQSNTEHSPDIFYVARSV
jgi:SAM-dependent methyltransferase